jgi:hypothetical protein
MTSSTQRLLSLAIDYTHVANAYDQVCEMIEGYDSDTMDSTQVADKVFTAIYTWLCKQPELSPDTLAALFAECMPPL